MIVTRRSMRDEVVVHYDIPGDRQSWNENAELIANQYGLSLDQAHRMLARVFPDIYEVRR